MNYSINKLLQYSAIYWKKFIIAIVSTLCLAAIESVMAWSIKPITEVMVDSAKHAWYVDWIWLLFVLSIMFRAGFIFITDYTANVISQSVVLKIRNQVFQHLIKLPKKYHDKNNIGSSTSLITYNVNLISDFCGKFIVEIVQNLALSLGLIVAIFVLDWQLCLIVVALSIPVVFVVKKVGKKAKEIQKNSQNAMAKINHCLHDNLRSLVMLKVYDDNNSALDRFVFLSQDIRRYILKANRLINLSRIINHLLISIPPAILIYIAINTSVNISAGVTVAVFVALMRIQLPLRRLAGYNNLIQQVVAAADSVFSLLEQPIEKTAGVVIKDVESIAINMENVSFNHDENLVLKNINLKIKCLEKVAIVGHSGSGKSTLLQLLIRLYDLKDGRILFNNQDINSLKLDLIRQKISFVGQDDMLLNLSIADNISYGQIKDQQRIIAAAKLANIDQFIDSLPDKYESLIGEMANNISGGQKQRMSIARALYKKSAIILLDEATSALDQANDLAILNNILHKVQATVIMTAHRLSSIKNLARIIVMHDGKIIAEGDHAYLIENCKIYNDLYKSNNA